MPLRKGARRDGRGGRGRGVGRVQPEGQPIVPAANPAAPVTHVDLGAMEQRKYNPKTFDGSLEDPTKAQMWLNRGTAWWETTERMLGGDVNKIIREQFKENVYTKFFTASLRDAKQQKPSMVDVIDPLYCWDGVGEQRLMGPEVVQSTNEAIQKIRAYMQTAHSKQKSYVDVRRKNLEFDVEDKVFLKVAPMKGVSQFEKKGKLIPHFV
ncbi:pol protein [Cucumis melo var. makuwa]|uniref:Pol protein n=1 Tax=Cucumis melo var. makuwa TaxID=1194695 RepID=A0A5A7TY10_CUCMM|nr:pol protein [Cucumis melo var. makuwa]TYK18926.1 pol protein [Cucumis melo var. makuwa]